MQGQPRRCTILECGALKISSGVVVGFTFMKPTRFADILANLPPSNMSRPTAGSLEDRMRRARRAPKTTHHDAIKLSDPKRSVWVGQRPENLPKLFKSGLIGANAFDAPLGIIASSPGIA